MAHYGGDAAERSVARDYQDRGFTVAHQRWRGPGGEIDLIVRHGDLVVFVEVKRSARFEGAALRVSPSQMQRIYTSAEDFLGGEPKGALTDARFDVALVDGIGAIKIIENAFGSG